MTEAELDSAVRQLCELYRWRRYHTYRSKRSPAGFPDLVLVKAPRLIFAELKSEDGIVKPEQEAWLADLRAVYERNQESGAPWTGAVPEVYVWRPRDLDEIARTLAPR